MKGFVQKGAAAVIAGMLLTGCGEPLKVMTESEQVTIVNYSAGVLSKFNQNQEDGITSVVFPVKEEPKEQIKEEQVEEPDTQPPNENTVPVENSDSGTQNLEDKGVTLTDALAVPGVSVNYAGQYTTDNFEAGSSLSMVAAQGKTYLVLNINLVNSGTAPAPFDMLSKKAVFTVKLNGKTGIKNEITLLSNDLSTFADSVQPGVETAAVLVFEVPKEDAAISTMELSLQVDGSTKKIILQ